MHCHVLCEKCQCFFVQNTSLSCLQHYCNIIYIQTCRLQNEIAKKIKIIFLVFFFFLVLREVLFDVAQQSLALPCCPLVFVCKGVLRV